MVSEFRIVTAESNVINRWTMPIPVEVRGSTAVLS
jgi:hypothetical protein